MVKLPLGNGRLADYELYFLATNFVAMINKVNSLNMREHTMRKLTALVAISFIAGMIGGDIGQRLADELWQANTAHAASGTPGQMDEAACDKITYYFTHESDEVRSLLLKVASTLHC